MREMGSHPPGQELQGIVTMPKTASNKPTTTSPYDVAEHLRTPAEKAAYLDAWLEEASDDTAGIAKALGNIARAKGMTQVARALDVKLHASAA